MDRFWLAPNRVVLLTSIMTALTMATLTWMYYLGNDMVVKHAPLVDAAMEIKLEATAAHLWFEEMVVEDEPESISKVWWHIEQADWYARAMLEGGLNSEGTFYPLTEIRERRLITNVRTSLADFRKMAEIRYQKYQSKQSDEDAHEKFNQLFHLFVEDADKVETMIQNRISEQLVTYRTWFIFTFCGTLSLFLYSIFLLYRSSAQNQRLVRELFDKNMELDYKAHFDQLTGLPNRVLFSDRLKQQVRTAKRNNDLFAVFFIDLDNFKSINDTHGHHVGDAVLVEVANRIASSVRENDITTRVSGDEFVVVAHSLENKKTAIRVAQEIAINMVQSVRKPVQLKDMTINATVSIGIAFYPQDSDKSETLVSYADSAMYKAKSKGRNQYQFYSDV